MKMATLTRQQQIGQLLFFGFDGLEVNGHARRAIRDYHIGNVILFARNFESPAQLFRLTQELQQEALAANGVPLFIAADQEGGSVTRFTSGVTWFPGEMALRAAGGPALCYENGSRLGWEMARLGLNFNLAPVVNLATNPRNPHIGSRSFGGTAEALLPYAREAVNGMQQYVVATVKHFPGIGSGQLDLHLAANTNEAPPEVLAGRELAPVRGLAHSGVGCVMSSHEVYAALDAVPGTFSHKINTGLLREDFGYTGLMVSDCMEMKAIQDTPGGTPEACVRALLAGVDMMLVCHTEELQRDAAVLLGEALAARRLPPERFEAAVERVLAAKQRFAALPKLAAPTPETDPEFAANRRFAARVSEKALAALCGEELFTPEPGEPFLLLAPPPAAITMADEDAGRYHLAHAAGRAFPAATCKGYAVDPDSEEVEGLCRLARGHRGGRVLVALYNATLYAGQQLLVERLAQEGVAAGYILLRSPFDARLCERAPGVLCAWEYTPPVLAALLRLLKGEIKAEGIPPAELALYLEEC